MARVQRVASITRAAGAAAAPDLEWLAPRLRVAGYTTERLRQALGITCPDDVGPLNRAPALERARSIRGPAGTAIRLLFLENDEPSGAVARLFSPHGCTALLRAGLLRQRGNVVRARARLDPIADQYFIADRRFRAADYGALRLGGRDPVYPPSSDSIMLRDAVQAPQDGRVLDLCTGSGIQALQQAPRADSVVTVDINPRAVAMARVNARLNGLRSIEARIGDLYAPVARETFDLIIANPPFVTSPYAHGPSYHAGGVSGDRVLRRIIAGWGPHLRAGGRAFAISHIARRARQDLRGMAQGWFRGFPGRALVVVVESGTAIDLAAAQSLFALEHGLRAYAAEVRRWVAYLRQHRITTISVILIAAERTTPAEVDVVEAPAGVLPIPLGPPPAQRIAGWLANGSAR